MLKRKMNNIALHIDLAMDRDVVLKCYSNDPWYDREWSDKIMSIVANKSTHHPIRTIPHIHGTVKSKITGTIVEPRDPLYTDLVT
jgi:hypothetical protein